MLNKPKPGMVWHKSAEKRRAEREMERVRQLQYAPSLNPPFRRRAQVVPRDIA